MRGAFAKPSCRPLPTPRRSPSNPDRLTADAVFEAIMKLVQAERAAHGGQPMTTVMARRVASTPVRSAAQTWAKIAELLRARSRQPRPKGNCRGRRHRLLVDFIRSPEGRADCRVRGRTAGAPLLHLRRRCDYRRRHQRRRVPPVADRGRLAHVHSVPARRR